MKILYNIKKKYFINKKLTMKSNITEKKISVQEVFDKVFDKYDLMNDIMSLGSHRLWKKQMISWLSPNKNTILLDM